VDVLAMAARESREGHKKRRPHTPTTGQECGRAQQKEEEKQKNAEKKNEIGRASCRERVCIGV
jgi:hypothetical protein